MVSIAIFYLISKLNGRVQDHSQAKANSENADHKQHKFIFNNLSNVLTRSAFLTHLQFYFYPTFAQFTFHTSFIIFLLDVPHNLDLQPFFDAFLVHVPHRALAFAGRDELVVPFFEVAETDAALFVGLGLGLGRRKGYVFSTDLAQLNCRVNILWLHLYQQCGPNLSVGLICGWTSLTQMQMKFKCRNKSQVNGDQLDRKDSFDCRDYSNMLSIINSHSNLSRLRSIMSDDQYQLEDRLRKMKAMTFCEERQARLLKRVFNVLVQNSKDRLRKYDEYYKMILYLKSFKGFMEFAIIKREEQLQQQNQQRLRETQEIEMRNAKEEEKMEKLIVDIERNRKARYIRKFCHVVKEENRLREQRQSKESFEKKVKKQEIIHKNIQEESAKRALFAQTQGKAFKVEKSQIDLLENSRRSISSVGYLTQDLQAKRKFAAIKVLPPKPLISEEKAQHKQAKETIKNDPVYESPLDQSSLNQSASLPQPSKRSSSADQNQQSSRTILSKKDEILALLSELKMAQILTLQGLIDQTTKNMKHETNLSEKRHIKQSLAILERISMLS